ncbi:MAG TPA: hypothetical protein VKR59_13170 [Terriglobales bacterium]|nr:hypothetical protein [Terriglobales bacterium]
MTKQLKAKGNITPIRRGICPRPTTAEQAAQLYLCWQMLSREEHSISEISIATGLGEALIAALRERFRGD